MVFIFFLFCVILLGILGFFFAAIRERIENETRTVSVEYEIIEDNG